MHAHTHKHTHTHIMLCMYATDTCMCVPAVASTCEFVCVYYTRERDREHLSLAHICTHARTHTHTPHTHQTHHTHTQHTHTPMYDRCWERGGGQQERDRPQAHVSAEQALRASAQRPRRNGVWTCVYECMCAVVRFRFVYAHAGVRVFACKGIHTLGARPAHCTGHDGKCDQTWFRV